MPHCHHCREYHAWETEHCPFCGKCLSPTEETVIPVIDEPAAATSPQPILTSYAEAIQESQLQTNTQNASKNNQSQPIKTLALTSLNLSLGLIVGAQLNQLLGCSIDLDLSDITHPKLCAEQIEIPATKPAAIPECPPQKPDASTSTNLPAETEIPLNPTKEPQEPIKSAPTIDAPKDPELNPSDTPQPNTVQSPIIQMPADTQPASPAADELGQQPTTNPAPYTEPDPANKAPTAPAENPTIDGAKPDATPPPIEPATPTSTI